MKTIKFEKNEIESQFEQCNSLKDIIEDIEKSGRPYVVEFTKQEKKARLRIRLFYGLTGIKENSSAFHYFYKEALSKSSALIYVGHSGLGKNLKQSEIIDYHDGEFSFDINPDKYQIFLELLSLISPTSQRLLFL